MAHPSKRNQTENENKGNSGKADLSARLASLDAQLSSIDAQRKEEEKPRNQPTSDRGAIGQGLKLSAEFVSGIIAGGLLGWLADRLFGWSPWGLVVCLLLGFCAGMLNMLRAAGVIKSHRKHDEP